MSIPTMTPDVYLRIVIVLSNIKHRGQLCATNLQRAKMLRQCNMNAVKTWSRFQVKNRGNPDIALRVIDLTKDLYDDYIDFQINHFVKREVIHQMAGIPYNIKALNEYKTYLSNIYNEPSCYSIVCCPEVEGKAMPKILASSILTLYQKNKWTPECDNVMVKTSEVRKYLEIDSELDNLCPINELMEKYGVKHAVDFTATTVHPDYARLGIASEIAAIGPKICEALDVQLSFAWITSEGTQKAVERNGWITEYEINAEEFAKKFNVTLRNLPPVLKFMIRIM